MSVRGSMNLKCTENALVCKFLSSCGAGRALASRTRSNGQQGQVPAGIERAVPAWTRIVTQRPSSGSGRASTDAGSLACMLLSARATSCPISPRPRRARPTNEAAGQDSLSRQCAGPQRGLQAGKFPSQRPPDLSARVDRGKMKAFGVVRMPRGGEIWSDRAAGKGIPSSFREKSPSRTVRPRVMRITALELPCKQSKSTGAVLPD